MSQAIPAVTVIASKQTGGVRLLLQDPINALVRFSIVIPAGDFSSIQNNCNQGFNPIGNTVQFSYVQDQNKISYPIGVQFAI